MSTHHLRTLGGEGRGAGHGGGCCRLCRAGLVALRFGCIRSGDGCGFRCVIRDGGIIVIRIDVAVIVRIILTPDSRQRDGENK